MAIGFEMTTLVGLGIGTPARTFLLGIPSAIILSQNISVLISVFRIRLTAVFGIVFFPFLLCPTRNTTIDAVRRIPNPMSLPAAEFLPRGAWVCLQQFNIDIGLFHQLVRPTTMLMKFAVLRHSFAQALGC